MKKTVAPELLGSFLARMDRSARKGTSTGFITINHTVDYMARGFMSFMRGVDITRAIGRFGLKVEPVLGPEIARGTASAIWAQNS